MTLGIKVGTMTDPIIDLKKTKSRLCEVWFNIDKIDYYNDLFKYVSKNKIKTGLHFWGSLPDGTWTNISYPDRNLIDISMKLIYKTIDIASKNKFSYVNIHPCSRAKVGIYFDKKGYKLLSKPVSLNKSIDLFIENASALSQYAKNRGVMFTVETVPLRAYNNWYQDKARDKAINIYELPMSAIMKAAENNIDIANDFAHSAAQTISDNPKEIWQNLYKWTKQLAPATKLIHLGFIVRPFNGTDYHDHLDNKNLFTDNAVPNYNQIIKLFKLFTNKKIFVITEPNDNHVKNYFLAQKILKKSLK